MLETVVSELVLHEAIREKIHESFAIVKYFELSWDIIQEQSCLSFKKDLRHPKKRNNAAVLVQPWPLDEGPVVELMEGVICVFYDLPMVMNQS